MIIIRTKICHFRLKFSFWSWCFGLKTLNINKFIEITNIIVPNPHIHNKHSFLQNLYKQDVLFGACSFQVYVKLDMWYLILLSISLGLDKPWGMSLRQFLDWVNWNWMIHSKCEWNLTTDTRWPAYSWSCSMPYLPWKTILTNFKPPQIVFLIVFYGFFLVVTRKVKNKETGMLTWDVS